ncbi:TPA: host cell division inhibitor Icd-like protein [Enterobacter hormaechei subsp. xiangfangensis]|nr:host cell division inhibitor Icd-like protein [Enterobacter hormaechei]QGR15013.1 host cell division inhibitor Icd-like protein [Enterobacter hormaechei]RTO51498.1 host cell division inhibitor Icd-like protein [Enterobacter hormaechei]HAS1875701.1 host cell division inhibitor Icd-like protein [Enterobacter hormaechei subsp. xiangfangensis]
MVAQNLSRRNPYAQINRVRLTYGDRDKGEQYSGSWQNNVKRGLEAPTKNVESCEDNQPSLRGEPLHNSLIVAQNRPFLRGAVHSITGSNPVQLSDSDLAFLRCRRLISPFTAVTMNCAFVSPSSRLLSKSATTSCGKRALSCCDLLLVEPVAIPESPCARCDSVYAKKIIVKGLKCDSLACSFKNKGAIHLVSAKPGSASTLTGPLTKPLVEVTVMAELQHTQTRPKYQYRFLALSAIGRNVIHITATTEREAREQSPAGCVMVFAGRLPVREGAPCVSQSA